MGSDKRRARQSRGTRLRKRSPMRWTNQIKFGDPVHECTKESTKREMARYRKTSHISP